MRQDYNNIITILDKNILRVRVTQTQRIDEQYYNNENLGSQCADFVNDLLFFYGVYTTIIA